MILRYSQYIFMHRFIHLYTGDRFVNSNKTEVRMLTEIASLNLNQGSILQSIKKNYITFNPLALH